MATAGATPSDLIAALGDPAGAELRETHGAWVVLAGGRAYKLKKPVVLPFLDYSSRARRLAACREEVAVNAPLAPGVYLGVRALVRTPDGPVLEAAADPPGAIDHVIEMRRFDERATFAARATDGSLDDSDIDALAELVAAFHRGAERCREGFAPRFEDRLNADLDELAAIVDPELEPRMAGWRHFATSALRRAGPQIAARDARGLCRDGHGDLRAEHVVTGTPPLVVDRIEFDPGLRRTDVASDLAFLTMDLERLGARQAAGRLTDSYARAGGDPGGPRLRAVYAWQRALVRLKVALIAGDRAQADLFAGLLDRLAWRVRAPRALLVCGAPASGKSTLATALGELMELPVVSSDLVRKQRAGIDPHARAPRGLYAPDATRSTYRALAARARAGLEHHGGVIIDATARTRELRGLLLAGLAPAALDAVLLCEVPEHELRRRAEARERQAARVSDAGADVALALAAGFEPPDELERAIVHRLRTDRSAGEIVAEVARRLDAALPALGTHD